MPINPQIARKFMVSKWIFGDFLISLVALEMFKLIFGFWWILFGTKRSANKPLEKDKA